MKASAPQVNDLISFFGNTRNLVAVAAITVLGRGVSSLSTVGFGRISEDLSEVERSFRKLKDLIEMGRHLPSPAQSGGRHFRRSLGLPAGSRAGEKTQGRQGTDVQRPGIGSLAHRVVDIRVGAEIRRGVTDTSGRACS